VIDLSGVEIIDASGLGELVPVAVAAQASGCSIKLASPGDFIWRLLSVTNLTSVFEVFSTVDAANLAFSGEAATAYAEF
jgi:anti-anti-sigma factor